MDVFRSKMCLSLQLAILLVTGIASLDASSSSDGVPLVVPDPSRLVGKNFIGNLDGEGVNIDKIFDDTLLPAIRETIAEKGLDPMQLDDIEKELHGIIGTKGVLKLTGGSLRGLSLLKRSGEAILSYKDKIVTIDATLGLDLVDVDYHYDFKYWLVKRSGSLRADLSDVNVRLVIEANLQAYKVALSSFNVVSVGKMNVKLQGHALDKVLNAAIKGFIGHFRGRVISAVEIKGAEVIRHNLEKINEKLPRPDRSSLTALDDVDDAPYGNAFDNSEMLNNIPTFIEFVIV